MGVNFCHLAGSASFDVFSDECFHVWPPVVFTAEVTLFSVINLIGKMTK